MLQRSQHGNKGYQESTKEELWCEVVKLRQVLTERDSRIAQLQNVIRNLQNANRGHAILHAHQMKSIIAKEEAKEMMPLSPSRNEREDRHLKASMHSMAGASDINESPQPYYISPFNLKEIVPNAQLPLNMHIRQQIPS